MNKKAEDVLAEVFPCVVACGLVEDDMEKYVLQFSGEDSYIHGSYELIVFRKIRRYIYLDQPGPMLVLSVVDDQVCHEK